MRRLLFHPIIYTLILLGTSLYVAAQDTTTLTGTVTDPSGQVWANASWTANINVPSGQQAVFIDTGLPVPLSYTGVLTGAGSFTGTGAVYGNPYAIVPVGVTWNITLASNTSAASQTFNSAQGGASFNLGTWASGIITTPQIQGDKLAYAYNANEIVNAKSGDGYVNTISNQQYLWNNGWIPTASGAGGIILPSYNVASLPNPCSNGQVANVINNIRGIWKCNASNTWQSITGYANIVDFGADPTGTIDSTTAIQLASTTAGSLATSTQNGQTVFTPTGRFTVSSTITLYSNVNYKTWQTGGGFWVEKSGSNTTIASYAQPGNPETNLVALENMGFDCQNNVNTSTVGVYFDNLSGGYAKNLIINNCATGIGGDSVRKLEIEHPIIETVNSGVNTGTYGIDFTANITGANETDTIDNGIFEFRAQAFHCETCTNIKFDDNYIESTSAISTGYAVQIINTSYGGEVRNNRITSTTQPFQLGPNFDAFVFDGNYTANTSGSYSAVVQTTGANGPVQIGTNFFDKQLYTASSTVGSFYYLPDLASASSHSVYGNFTGSSARPTFSNAPVFNMSALTNMSNSQVTSALGYTPVNSTSFSNWTNTTPVPVCDIGTPTAISSSVNTQIVGKTAFVNFQINLSSVGTCSGGLQLNLPFTAATSVFQAGVCRERNNTGNEGVMELNGGSSVEIRTYNNGGFTQNGDLIYCSGVFQTQ